MKALFDVLSRNLNLKEPFFIHNIKLFPITGEFGNNGFSTLEEGLSSREIEMIDTRGVNEIIIKNHGTRRVFAIDGEEIIGARQNRILNTDVYIEPQSEYVVPVTCIEQHRWEGSRVFEEAGFTVTPSLRSTLALTIKESLDRKRGFQSNQSLIWTKIDHTLKSTRVNSITSSFHDVYKSLGEIINEIMEGFDTIRDSIGFAAFINDEFIALDLFCTNSLYQKFERKLLKSYILDGYIRKYTKERGIKITPGELLKRIGGIKCNEYPAVTRGHELRGFQDDILVKAYIPEDNPIHVSAFAVAEG